ncbi:MAG: hypothetical protein Q8O67_18035 [Deltaproteobacteria bacterium]|nr:hypothetical protein [Deltaproteobacteria bacterium]
MEGSPVVDDATEMELVVVPKPLAFTRGMNARAAVSWVRHHHGPAGVERLASSLAPDLIHVLGPDLRPRSMGWIPFMVQARLLEGIDQLFGRGDYRLLRDVGRHMAMHDFPAIARPLARMLSPGLFVDLSVKIWRLYNTHGRWEVSRGPREINAVRFESAESHIAFCEGTMGWIEGAMMFCGAVDVVATEERCCARGGPCCSVRVRWVEASDNVVARDRRPRPPT